MNVLTFPIFSQVSIWSLLSSHVSRKMAVRSTACDLLVTGAFDSCCAAISSGIVAVD